MEAHHVLNPWQQQQRHQKPHDPYNIAPSNTFPPPDTFPLTDAETKSFDDFFQDHKKVLYQSQRLLEQLKLQQKLKHQNNTQDRQEEHSEGDEDGETDSQGTAWSQLGMDSPLNQSSLTLADSTTVLFLSDPGSAQEGDVLETLVHTLQSEVKDTRATVFELESRLDLAEHSNRYIVEELKMLLADAEVTLCTAGQPSGNDPSPSAHKKGALSDEDSNIVYNRICVALQTLIDEAQLALQKNPSAKQAIPNPIDDIHPTPLKLTEENKALDEATMRSRLQDNFDPEHNLARRKSPRSSITLLDSEKIHDNASYHDLTTCSPTSYYSATGEVSRIYWKQKHEEQHDRYRKSSHRLTLELDRRFHNLTTDSDDSEASSVVSRRSRSHVSSSAQSSTPSTPTTPTQPLQGILRSSKKDGAKKERLKKKYQVQFLNADIPESRHRDIAVSTAVYTDKQQLQQTQQRQPQYTSRSVGSTRSRGVILQLYDLWQHTWLRTRIMHVITGSVEIVIIIWVVVKASRFTLTWLGFQPTSVTHWITFIYGHRDSAGAGAKELYAKIRKDGLQMRQFKAWSRKEPEALIEDFVAGAAASSGLISPSKMVYGPAKRAVAHAVTGMALALLSDGARRLVRKL